MGLISHKIKKHKRRHGFTAVTFYSQESACKYLKPLLNDGIFSYRKSTGIKKNKTGPVIHYRCNFKEDSNILNCKSFIIFQKYNKRKKIRIISFSSHQHESTFDGIRFQESYRNDLTNSLSNGVALNTLHSQVTSYETLGEINKNHCVTKNYLRYLRRDCKKNESFSNDDLTNSFKYLKHLRTEGKLTNFVLKDKGVKLIGYEEIEDNFVLAYQSTAQYETMMAEKSNYVMVDSTHSTNIYGYPLITFAILTRKQRFSPFIFIITDSDSEKTLKYVFDIFIGQNLFPKTPTILMSDMARTYFNIWSKTVNSSVEWYYCNYHLKTAVTNNIDQRIHDKKLNQEIKDKFEKLNTLSTKKEFKKQYARFLQLSENSSPSFFKYFVKTYGNCVDRWALYQRVSIEVNANNFCESFHGSFKKEFLDSRSNHRLDSLLIALNAYDLKIHLHFYLSTRSMNKEYLGYREITALKKHELAKTLDSKKFKQRKDVFYYKKYRIRSGLCKKCDNDCVFLCRLCGICKDRYTCECLSFVMKKQMCKHVHKVHEILSQSQTYPKHTHPKTKVKSIEPIVCTNGLNANKTDQFPVIQSDRSADTAPHSKLHNNADISEENTTRKIRLPHTNTDIHCAVEHDITSQASLEKEGVKLSRNYIGDKIVGTVDNEGEFENRMSFCSVAQNDDIQPISSFPHPLSTLEALVKRKTLIIQQLESIQRKVQSSESIISLNRTHAQLKYVDVTHDVFPSFKSIKHEINTDMRSKPMTQHMKLDEKYKNKKNKTKNKNKKR